MSKTTKKASKKPATKKAQPAKPVAVAAPAKPSPFLDDPRLPAVGTTMDRVYKGKTFSVKRLEDRFEWEGRPYRSLSAIAREILDGASVNGFLWFGLTERAGKTASAPKATKQSAKGSAPKGRRLLGLEKTLGSIIAPVPGNELATPAGQRQAVADLLLAPRAKKGKKAPKTKTPEALEADAAHAAAEGSQESAPTV